MTRLRKLDPILLPKVVITVTTTQFGRVLCFAFSDGTIQYRDRFTMNEIYGEPSPDTIMHPLQAGFQYLNDTPCEYPSLVQLVSPTSLTGPVSGLQVAFSPTNCSFVQISEDSTLKWNRLHYPIQDPIAPLPSCKIYGLCLETVLTTDSFFPLVADLKPVLIALTVPLSSTAVAQVTCDDILAMARPFAQVPDFSYSWIREIIGMLKIVVDYSEESHHEQLVRNSLLQLCLSILNHLNFRGDFKPRSLDGKFALLALSVRNIFVVITVATNTPMGFKEKLNPLDDPEVVDAVTGCAKWGLSLLAWITDSLFQLLDDPEITAMLTDPKRFPELAKRLHSKNDVSLQLLLCSSTRGFLSAACRRLMNVETVSNRAAQYYETHAQQQAQDPSAGGARPHPALYQAYQRMVRAFSSSLVKVSEFERLLSELSSDIQAAYQKTFAGLNAAKMKPQHANMTEQQQQQLNEQFARKAQMHCELDMLLGRNVPPGFREMLLKFFTVTLPAFRNQTDPARLYFANYDLLEMEDSPKAIATKKALGRYVDVFKRVELAVGPRPRRAVGQANGSTAPAATNGAAKKPAAGGEDARNHNGVAGMQLHGSWTGMGGSNGPHWRRCVRCAAVMEDLWSGKPGYNFVLTQQRKCMCGGGWATVPRGV